MYGPDAIIPGDVAALAGTAGSRMDITLKVVGYGDVPLSIVVR